MSTFVPNHEPTPGSSLAGKVAIVTGGASGIGDAVGRIFAANQAKVLLVDIDDDRLKKVVAEHRRDRVRPSSGSTPTSPTRQPCSASSRRPWTPGARRPGGEQRRSRLAVAAGHRGHPRGVEPDHRAEPDRGVPGLPGGLPGDGEAVHRRPDHEHGLVVDQDRLRPRAQPVPGLQARHARLQQEHPARGQGQEDRRDGDQPVARGHADDRDHRQGPVRRRHPRLRRRLAGREGDQRGHPRQLHRRVQRGRGGAVCRDPHAGRDHPDDVACTRRTRPTATAWKSEVEP